MSISLSCVQGTAPDTILLHEDNTPPGLLESWADCHDYCLALEFGPEPPLTEEQ
jgi:hypothetical protein